MFHFKREKDPGKKHPSVSHPILKSAREAKQNVEQSSVLDHYKKLERARRKDIPALIKYATSLHSRGTNALNMERGAFAEEQAIEMKEIRVEDLVMRRGQAKEADIGLSESFDDQKRNLGKVEGAWFLVAIIYFRKELEVWRKIDELEGTPTRTTLAKRAINTLIPELEI